MFCHLRTGLRFGRAHSGNGKEAAGRGFGRRSRAKSKNFFTMRNGTSRDAARAFRLAFKVPMRHKNGRYCDLSMDMISSVRACSSRGLLDGRTVRARVGEGEPCGRERKARGALGAREASM